MIRSPQGRPSGARLRANYLLQILLARGNVRYNDHQRIRARFCLFQHNELQYLIIENNTDFEQFLDKFNIKDAFRDELTSAWNQIQNNVVY